MIDLREYDVENAREIDMVCDRFEEAMQRGENPQVETYLENHDLRQPLLQELLLIELEYRLKRHEVVEIGLYRQRFDISQREMDALLNEAMYHAEAQWDLDEAGTAPRVTQQDPSKPTTDSGNGQQKSPGDRLGKFELLSVAGRGGFGVVWKARDPDLNRLVALKEPIGPSLTEDQAGRFLREARAVARLRHQNIVPIFETGWTNGNPYIVSDFIEGSSLADFLNLGSCDIPTAIHICSGILDGLHYAHERGVIHRDVKPSNVMLDHDRVPLVTDFGLSQVHGIDTHTTQIGTVMGTPGYMSPEQAKGLGHLADHRADIYAVGVILYQLLTGDLPFRGRAVSVMDAVIRTSPASPRSINPSIPKELDRLCLKALKKRPDERFASAAEFAHCLRSCAEGKKSFRPRRSWTPYLRATAVMAMVVCLVAVAVVIGRISLAETPPVGTKESKEDLAQSAQKAIEQLHFGDHEKGIRELVALIEKEPNPDWICELAYARIRFGNDFEGALEYADQALVIDSQHPRSHYIRYLALRGLNRLREAYYERNIATLLGDPVAIMEEKSTQKPPAEAAPRQ